MLNVNFESVAEHAMPVAKWVDRMLWKWSPWHLRVKLAESEDNYREAAQGRARLWRQNTDLRERKAQLLAYIERDHGVLMIPTSDAKVLAEDDPRLMAHRIDVILPKWSFMVYGRSFEYACQTDDLMDYMARDYAQRMAHTIETAMVDILRQKAAARC